MAILLAFGVPIIWLTCRNEKIKTETKLVFSLPFVAVFIVMLLFGLLGA